MHLDQSLDKKHCALRRLGKYPSLRKCAAPNDDGYAIAEFAVALPALLMFGFGLLAVLGMGAEEIALNAKCAEVTRIISRGDQLPDAIALDNQYIVAVTRSDGLVDVELRKKKKFSIFGFTHNLEITAHAAALDELALT